MEKDGETLLFRYSDSGVLDDITNMRSLKLSAAAIEAMSGILSSCVELSVMPMRIPDLGIGEIQIKP